jgi:hypothetical protein
MSPDHCGRLSYLRLTLKTGMAYRGKMPFLRDRQSDLALHRTQ